MDKILIVDDDFDIRNILRIYLASEDCEIYEAEDGAKALEIIDETFDLIILDNMMPNLNGSDTLKEIRSNYNIPVIFVSAKVEESDKYKGLMEGADDYITKPFSPIDLVARVKGNIRRYKELGSKNQIGNSKASSIVYKNITVDLDAHTVFKNGEIIKLTKSEFNILKLLIVNQGVVFSSEQIAETIFNDPSIHMGSNNISVHIRNLRQKIELDSKHPKIISNVWGVGYKVEKE